MTKKTASGKTAADIMQTHLVEVPESMSLAEVAEVLSENRISGAPVIDEAGTIIGVVSMSDVVGGYADAARPARRERPEYDESVVGNDDAEPEDEGPLVGSLAPDDGDGTVRDVMTAQVHTVPANASIAEIARRMVEHQIHRIFVTDRGKHVGLVSSFDVLRAIC
jgi:CBS domain-containing protein